MSAPAQMHSAVYTSPAVAASPSSQVVPGRAVPPGAPAQSSSTPTQAQFAFHASLPVLALFLALQRYYIQGLLLGSVKG